MKNFTVKLFVGKLTNNLPTDIRQFTNKFISSVVVFF